MFNSGSFKQQQKSVILQVYKVQRHFDIEDLNMSAEAEITGNKTATGNDKKMLLLEYITPQGTRKNLRRYAACV